MPDCLFDYAVYIGRFQPPHRGHCSLIRQAAALAPRLILAVGSVEVAPSLRNPFSFGQRKAMFASFAEELPVRLDCVPVRDSAYNFTEWLIEVHRRVQSVLAQDELPDAKVVLVGAFKDASSFYLDYFPGWSFRQLDVVGDYNSTAIRNRLFDAVSGADLADLSDSVEPSVLAYLRSWLGTPEHAALSAEYRQVCAYRQSWAAAPYPPVFVTVDAVVFCNNRVLLVRRGGYPGKGSLALPGGFLEPEERLFQACLRELAEETGLRDSDLKNCFRLSDVFDDPQRDPRGRVVTHAFMFDLGHREILPAVAAADDAAEAVWFPLCDLDISGCQFFGDHHRIIRYFVNRLR